MPRNGRLWLAFCLALLVALLGRNVEASGRHRGVRLTKYERLAKSIVHRVYSVRVGRGEFDTIRIHRVTRVPRRGAQLFSQRPGKRPGIMLVHGLSGTFTNAFLAGTLPSADTKAQSLAVFLARRGIDVWGIDLSWSIVPGDVQDVDFMSDWGLQRQIDEISKALLLARVLRFNREPMHLLGYSLGGVLGTAVLNEEATKRRRKRQVKGWIPFDTATKNPDAVDAACMAAALRDVQLQNGIFRDGGSAAGIQIGTLALEDPGGASPFAPGLTNEQFGLVVAASPQPTPPPGATNPFYHFFAGIFDPVSGLPVDLTHVRPTFAFEWVQSLGGGTPVRLLSDAGHLTCGDIDSPFDDNLDDVNVPVLYVGADGGFGEDGIKSLEILGSTDVTIHIVDLVAGNRLLDYGHIDLGTASNAGFLAWETIVSWIRERER